MLKSKRTKGLLIALVLIIALVPAVCFAGSWYTLPVSGYGTYNSDPFQNSGQPYINLTFYSSSNYRTYTIALQRQQLDGTWVTEESTSGSINANTSKQVSYFTKITNTALNTYHFRITINDNTYSSGTAYYYK